MASSSDVLNVVFPSSRHHKIVKLVIRNTSHRVLVIKLKTSVASSLHKKVKPQSTVIPPKSLQHIDLVLLPPNVEELSTDDLLKFPYVPLHENDQVEIYCRPLSVDVSADGIKKQQYKVAIPGNSRELYRLTYLQVPSTNELADKTKQEKDQWWENHLNNYAEEHEERYQELNEWINEDIDEPERLVQKLRAIRDGKRFVASMVLVEAPGKASLVESVPYTIMMADDPDCLTARDMAFGTSTAKSLKNYQLLQLARSNSECDTMYSSSKQYGCEWIARWMNWFIPVKSGN